MAEEVDRCILPIPRRPFAGAVSRPLAGSVADWRILNGPSAPDDAPNVLLVLIDDAGFGNPGTFGGPVSTPHLTAIAEEGLRYNRSPFEFTGTIHQVVFDIDPHLAEEDRQGIHEHEQHAALAHGIGA